MCASRIASLAAGAAVFVGLGITGLTAAQFGLSGPGSQLGMPQYMKAESKPLVALQNNEGIYVNKATFSVHMGRPKTVVPTEALKNAAHEVSEGAIIVRHDGKLYVIDASLVTE
jgi:hypothetical protein